ncbi:ATP-binding cassette domain-containing protein [Streptomyces uncialis]|uniref:ATP-binding cassette domain-containing protein n=1 Tax=Streptomyces uncialis TaxID=1048205 RepID=UPI003869A07F
MITLHGLTKTYGTVHAVHELTLDVHPGRVTGFLGPNGAGKSTTVRMILGLDRPTAGRALVAGRRYEDLRRPLREVGALLDAKAMHPGRTAANHLLAMARSNGIPRRRVDEVLDAVGLTAVAGRRVGLFSLGMGQRLGVAGALLGDPGVLIFDEPVNGLDPDGVRWIRRTSRSLAAEGRTVFLSSHLMSELQRCRPRRWTMSPPGRSSWGSSRCWPSRPWSSRPSTRPAASAPPSSGCRSVTACCCPRAWCSSRCCS